MTAERLLGPCTWMTRPDRSDTLARMTPCPTCGTENQERAKFCAECGTPLSVVDAGPAREVRKLVTLLFVDMAGSTDLGEQLDPEAVRALLGRYFAIMQRIIESHGGTVEKFVGDAVMAVFGIPVLHEDDALRAVRAADDVRTELDALGSELEASRGLRIRFRTGLNTGQVVAGDPTAGKTLVTGDAVNTAARIQQAASPGEILLGRPTWQLVRDAVEAEPVEPIAARARPSLSRPTACSASPRAGRAGCAGSTGRSSAESAIWHASIRRSERPPSNGAVSCSPCWARPASARAALWPSSRPG